MFNSASNYNTCFQNIFKDKFDTWIDVFLTSMQLFLHNTLIDGLESCGLFVDYCDVSISCLDGTHSL